VPGRWPLFDLCIRTPRLELRPDWDEGLLELAEEAARGIHDPAFMPFLHPWTAVDDDARALGVLQWNWKTRGELTPEKWALNLLVCLDGRVVGTQGLMAEHFAKLRTVETGSWIGLEHQGRGIGREMRAAALHLAFAGLGAARAVSSAFEDNTRSLRVSRALGYEDDGEQWYVRGTEQEPGRVVRLKLSRERWESHRPDYDITIEHLEACLPLLGAQEAQ
jgi:RimJ/RimL family protein N-acetyltransferase